MQNSITATKSSPRRFIRFIGRSLFSTLKIGMSLSKNAVGRSTADMVQVTTSIAPLTRPPEVANGPKLYPPSPLLCAPINRPTVPISSEHKQIERGESSHTITVPEPHMCRICDPDDDNDDVLVELGCSCKGQLSKMHRKCIIEWYGIRMLVNKVFNCELCKKSIGDEAQIVVAQAVRDHVTGGRAVLLKALKGALGMLAEQINLDSATTFEELVQLLLDNEAHIMLPGTVSVQPRRTIVIRRNSQTRKKSIVCWTAMVVFLLIMISAAFGVYIRINHMPAGEVELH